MIYNVFCIIEYIKTRSYPNRESKFGESMGIPNSKNMRYNKDLYKELFIFTLEEEQRAEKE